MNVATFFQTRTSLALLTLGLILAGPATALAQEGNASTHCFFCFGAEPRLLDRA
jgi:hypothetical protein